MSAGLRDQLQAIRDEHGALTPELVVDAARDPSHPLHPRFEWDDSVAAERWRVEQASQLLRVTFRPDPSKPVELRAFVALRGPDTPRSDYVPLGEVATDEIATKLLMQQMKRDWETFRRRYQHHDQFMTFLRGQLAKEAS